MPKRSDRRLPPKKRPKPTWCSGGGAALRPDGKEKLVRCAECGRRLTPRRSVVAEDEVVRTIPRHKSK
jgi:hypothetical protein